MNIRNFAIIAHVDHGKSTLADRFLELTNVITKDNHPDQFLDRHPISRERGITIKLAPVRLIYNHNTKGEFILNLIDTPGHIDFSYEVERTLACVEGVILLVDATQGIQAQTISNLYRALEKDLIIIPAVNKIDLPTAQVAQTKDQIVGLLGLKEEEIFEVSAKTGFGVENLINAVIEKIPPPKPSNLSNDFCRGLIFDSYYDPYLGVIAFVRMIQGKIIPGMKLRLFHSNAMFEVKETGYFTPDLKSSEALSAGEIGYVVTGLKELKLVRIGDTILFPKSPIVPLSGYKTPKPMVYASVFPTETKDYPHLEKSLNKLALNDSALVFVPVYSRSLGAGFRVGFLGLLHADIVRERLERDFGLDLILTPPQVEFKSIGGKFFEPIVKGFILTNKEYLGSVIKLLPSYRAKLIHMDVIGKQTDERLQIIIELPLAELISDFFDKLKSATSGWASFDWEMYKEKEVEAGPLEILLNGQVVQEFSEIVVQEKARQTAEYLVNRLKELIPKQQFEVRIQASYRGKIIASARLSPLKKNVLVKAGKVLGTGDVGRKRKLLERQKEGKKRLKMIGKVEVPKSIFVTLFQKKN